MKKEFIKELTELINKHCLESEMRDTPDYILAQICVDAMAVFSEAIARRDEWHGFKKADESDNSSNENTNTCQECNERFKCIKYLVKQPISVLTERLTQTFDKDEVNKIALAIQEKHKEKNKTEGILKGEGFFLIDNGENPHIFIRSVRRIKKRMKKTNK